jgi:hypothetical protein
VLIALEFNHTVHVAFTRERGVIQAKIVILVALASLILALGVTYWLMRERDDRLRKARGAHQPLKPAVG